MSIVTRTLHGVFALSAATSVAAGGVWASAPAQAAEASGERAVSGVSFQWGVNAESGGGAYYGGCNFLSAGEAGDAGSSRLWQASDVGTLYQASEGNTSVLKPDSEGDLVAASWETRCQNRYGTSIGGRTAGLTITGSGTPAEQPTYSENVVRIAGGSGTLDPSTDSAHIEWDGSFTIVYYGGMTYWSISDPVLDVENGTGTITGTASGIGASMDDPTRWEPLESMEDMHLADLSGVEVSESGIEVTPDFLGVSVPDEINGRNSQAERTSANESWWGAFPASWLEFNTRTQQDSYWYTTDGGAKTIQPRKPAAPISIAVPDRPQVSVTPAAASPGASVRVSGGTMSAGAAYTVDLAGPGESGAVVAGPVTATADESGAFSLDLTVPEGAAEGSYRVRVLDSDGNLTASADLEVEAAAPPVDPDGDDDDDGGTDDQGDGSSLLGTAVNNAVFRWGMNDETNSKSFYGSCNYLSAGLAGNSGSARVWSASDVGALYRASDGNVSIQKPDANGTWVQASWDTRCLDRDGNAVTLGWREDGRAVNTESQVVIAGGTGTIGEDGSVDIQWTGSWTVAYYDGMTYWSVSDPKLTLDAQGDGQVTATASGFGTDMDDTSKWETLRSTTIVLADLSGVDVVEAAQSHGFTQDPDYLGVTIDDAGGRNEQASPTGSNKEYWGSFPQSFIDFQVLTGQSSYWYTSDGQRDRAKVASPLSVAYDGVYSVAVPEGSQAASSSPAATTRTSTAAGGKTQASTGASPSASAAQSGGAQSGDDGAASSAAVGTGRRDGAGRIALGAGSIALASGAPLALAWLIRRRLELDPAVELSRRGMK
ncbi:MAG: hypothetical protein LKI58_04520 [Actinomyces sp.]|jgi:hypothetical protein|nr:hypothetical protein [Actinomyces sp.]MCI1787316.1 hypothetical protein [Actinomyces sp.]MCI1830864.1 hypothetical protein [Actinomyces sp.]